MARSAQAVRNSRRHGLDLIKRRGIRPRRGYFQARIARVGAGEVDAVVLSNTNPSQTAKTIETSAANSRAGGGA
jgi:porphobilinogen deaminase